MFYSSIAELPFFDEFEKTNKTNILAEMGMLNL